jgi:hypothetical protein
MNTKLVAYAELNEFFNVDLKLLSSTRQICVDNVLFTYHASQMGLLRI